MAPRHEHIGAKLKSVRRSQGVSGKELALAVGTTPSHLCAIENGRVASPRYELVCAMADYLGITIAELDGEIPSEETGPRAEAQLISRWYIEDLSASDREAVFKMIRAVRNETLRTRRASSGDSSSTITPSPVAG